MNASDLPTLNASLNALAGLFLFLGWRAIKDKKPLLHRRYMVTALVCSTLFLCSYLTYHYLKEGVVTRYQGEGILRVFYLFILGSHTPLAAIIPPFAIMAARYGFKGQLEKHTRITKWLYPVWIYVSLTGVLIYLMLYVFKP